MATAQVTIKATPPELKTICDALKMYADVMLAVGRAESVTEVIKQAVDGADARREVHYANAIRDKIGY
jgi:hypothetical protein